MKSLINLKRDVIYKLAEKYKFYDEDIDTRENLFSFNDFIKDNK